MTALLLREAIVATKHYGFSESKVDIAAATVKKYAYEAYPQWRLFVCPSSLLELNDFMNSRDTKDPWGTDYELFCDLHGVIVRSAGEDGVRDTSDDIWSNR